MAKTKTGTTARKTTKPPASVRRNTGGARAKASGSEARQLTEVVRFRASKVETTSMLAAANEANVSVSSYIRAKVLDGTPIKRTRSRQRPVQDAELLVKLLGQLGKVGNNLNQIAHRLNSDENVTRAQVVKTLADVHDVRNELLKTLGRAADGDRH